jgi:DNA-binding response OmpR family regulator
MQRAGVKSADTADTGVQHIGDLVIDGARQEASLRDRVLQLTPTEYRLLCQVARHRTMVVSPEQLAESVWGSVNRNVVNSLQVHMRRLRVKLSAANSTGPRLVTRRGLAMN